MKTQTPFSRALIIGLAVAVVILTAAVLPLQVLRGADIAPSAQADPIPLESTYRGQARLDWAVPGVYSDTLTAPEGTLPELGSIDLGFLLHCAQNNLTGYVDLSSTLVFTGEHIITTQSITTPFAVGPAVHGVCGGSDLQIESERFDYLGGAGRRVTRQFRLTGASTGVGTFSGEYRETLWGYAPEPLTIVGEFNVSLISGANIAIAFSHRIYLPVLLR